MPIRFLARWQGHLLHLLLIGPRRIGPHLYDLYAHGIVARMPLTKAVCAGLAQTPDFLPHYLYLNLGRALAIDPVSARLFVAGPDGGAFRPLADVVSWAGMASGLGYRLQIAFSDGGYWRAQTLVSVEPLYTAEVLLAATLDGGLPGDGRPLGPGKSKGRLFPG